MSHHDIADRNVERLLGAAYKPEPIDPAFVLETEEKVLAAARDNRRTQQTSPADTARLLRIRRRLSWAMAAAAVGAVLLVSWYSVRQPTIHGRFGVGRKLTEAEKRRIMLEGASAGLPKNLGIFSGLTAKPRAESQNLPALAVGKSITTKHNERRRVALSDGSILFVNENTSLTQTAERQLRLERGDIYLEVAPREGQQFTVKTAARDVVATGTHFHVAASAAGAGVLVTQGTVKVSDVPKAITAGQQVKPGQKQPSAAPRASHVLDWLKPLVAAAEAPLVPGCSHEGGALIALDPNGQELQLSMRKYHIDVHIEDGFARTTIDQTYFNNTWSRLEGTFYFPLPPDASLSRLAMYVLDGNDCKLMEGGMAERDHARNAFETIRHERRDPALLEWVDGSTFKMRVFPLEAWQEKRIILSYTQRLSSLYGVAKYRFPGGHNMQIVRDWSFAATVKNANQIDVLTPSHPDMKRESNETMLGLRTAAQLIKPEQDVVLELREREAPRDGATFATHLQDGQRYFMARYRPKLDTRPQRQRRDWIVLFESSANRDPLLARTQIDVFRNLLKNAEYDDTFVLLSANTRTQLYSAKPQAALPANVKAAVEFLEKSHLVGGCDLEQALRKSLEFAKGAKNPHLVHIGAGVPSLGEPKDDVLAKLIPEELHYIGVGVGKKWNRAFMKMAADRTSGYFTQINPDEPVAWRAFDLLATLNTPRLLDVRVVDPDERVAYLADAVTLAQGEEICAYARGPVDKFELPKKVLITGRLEGRAFRQEIDVADRSGVLSHEAAYLPRTWAKLEIDRLLADGQDKNKAAITELSKQMYVMSPFTSLLVLESEADYKRFNIDRGRKDHWAMYACPERIAKVYEPDPAYQRWWSRVQQPQDGQKPSEEQVLDTILMRLPPQYIYAQGRQAYLPRTATARQVLLSVYAVPQEADVGLGLMRGDRQVAQFWRFKQEMKLARLSELGDFEWLEEMTAMARDSRSFPRPSGGGGDSRNLLSLLPMSEAKALSLGLFGLEDETRSAGARLSLAQTRLLRRRGAESRVLYELLEREQLSTIDLFGRAGQTSWNFEREQGKHRIPYLARLFRNIGTAGKPQDLSPGSLRPAFRRLELDRKQSILSIDLAEKVGGEFFFDRDIAGAASWSAFDADLMMSSLDGIEWPKGWKQTFEDAWMLRLAQQVQTRQSASWLAYQRPQYQVDDRLFGDLTIHAPGLSTSWADLQSTVAREANQERPPTAGKIDDGARALFGKARQLGWHAVAIPGVGRIPGFKVYANGQGQFTYQRTLSSGLVEQVVCDGQTLWHLYPEIGLGTRRPFSRFHFGELSRWMPWALPRIEDLALDADLKLVDADTVALVPHIEPQLLMLQKDQAPPPSTRQFHFVFAADGSLAETRLVEMPSGQVLVRQTFDSAGTIRMLDKAGKQLAQHKFDRQAAVPQNVQPALTELVVLDMPLRTGVYWDRQVHQLRARVKNNDGDPSILPAYLGLFASSCFSRDRDSLPMFGAYFHAKGDKRLGFYTLLSARETHFLQQPNTRAQGIATFDPVQEHPGSPLARYLAHHQKNLRVAYEADATFLEDLPGAADGFIARMAAFRNAWNAWRHYHLVGRDPAIHQREKAKLMDFVRVNTSPLIAFLLQSNVQHLNTHDRADLTKLIVETQKDYVAPLGLGYVLGYDAATHLHYKGDAKQAAQIFRDLYEQAVKEGMLPKIDGTFRSALDAAGNTGPNFGAFLRGVVHDFLKKDQPHFALLVALQASHFGSPSLGDELFQHIAQRLPKNADRLVWMAELEYLAHHRLDARADVLREKLLADDEAVKRPAVWRLSAALAHQRGQLQRAVADLETAIELEYQQMPDLINLDIVRRDYRELLGRYLDIAKAAQTLGHEAPKNLAGRVVRAADRWRALDSEPREVCQTAAKILKLLGAADLARDYRTTPIALKPNEAAPWTDLAGELRGEGELELADDAYARAFVSESTNPQILWDRAQNLLQMGKIIEARRLWQQIADGGWQERFQQLVPQARWHLEHN